MTILQKEIQLKARKRGFHLVTEEILSQIPEIKSCKAGILHIFIKHTSASICLNENADPSVRGDLERHFDHMVPEDQPYFEHTYEGADDMPSHIKAVLIGSSLQIPVTGGKLNLGTWQGVYLCEHRNYGGNRGLLLTLLGS